MTKLWIQVVRKVNLVIIDDRTTVIWNTACSTSDEDSGSEKKSESDNETESDLDSEERGNLQNKAECEQQRRAESKKVKEKRPCK